MEIIETMSHLLQVFSNVFCANCNGNWDAIKKIVGTVLTVGEKDEKEKERELSRFLSRIVESVSCLETKRTRFPWIISSNEWKRREIEEKHRDRLLSDIRDQSRLDN